MDCAREVIRRAVLFPECGRGAVAASVKQMVHKARAASLGLCFVSRRRLAKAGSGLGIQGQGAEFSGLRVQPYGSGGSYESQRWAGGWRLPDGLLRSAPML